MVADSPNRIVVGFVLLSSRCERGGCRQMCDKGCVIPLPPPQVLVGGASGRIQLWNFETGTKLHTFDGW